MPVQLINFEKGSYDPVEDKIICKDCGYIGTPETDFDIQTASDKILICPNCDQIIGAVSPAIGESHEKEY
jgi:hypothetical protein